MVLSTDRQYFDNNDVRTVVRTVDLAEPASPAVVAEQTYDAELLSARQYGDTVRLVVGSGLPDLDFVQPTGSRSESEARAENRAIVRASTIEDWLPTVRDGDGRGRAARRLRRDAAPGRPSPAPAAWSWSASTPPTPAPAA